MIKPGMLAVLTPVVIAFGFKYVTGSGIEAAQALGGLLAGNGERRITRPLPSQRRWRVG